MMMTMMNTPLHGTFVNSAISTQHFFSHANVYLNHNLLNIILLCILMVINCTYLHSIVVNTKVYLVYVNLTNLRHQRTSMDIYNDKVRKHYKILTLSLSLYIYIYGMIYKVMRERLASISVLCLVLKYNTYSYKTSK